MRRFDMVAKIGGVSVVMGIICTAIYSIGFPIAVVVVVFAVMQATIWGYWLMRSDRFAQQMEMFKLAVSFASDQIVITDKEGIIVYANEALKKLTGFEPSEVIGKKTGTKDLWGGQMEKEFYKNMWDTLTIRKQIFKGEIRNRRRNGEQYTALASIAPVLTSFGSVAYFVAIERDITKEKAVDRMKTEFISLASHQLRTPLSAIKWFVELMTDGSMGKLSVEQNDALTNIKDSTERMIALINDLLNISRLESGRLTIEPKLLEVDTLVNSLKKEVETLASEKQVKLVIDVGDGIPKIKLDPQLMGEIWVNLLSNAIKFTLEKGEVDWRLYVKDGELITEVKDSGVGIPKEDQVRLGERFFRANNISSITNLGTGLGLYLIKSILSAAGGRMWFESEESKGSTFWVAIPMEGMRAHEGEVEMSGKQEKTVK